MHKMVDSYFVVVSQKQRKTGASVPVFLYHQYKKNNNHGIEAAWLLFSGLCNIVGSQGLEPWTHGLRVRCSTN